MRSLLPRIAVLIGLLVLLPGIGGLSAQEEEDEEGRGPEEFVVSFLEGDLELNPMVTYTSTEAQIYTALYEGLVSYNPRTLDPMPAVARNWDVSPDGLTYQFYLREDARYWNGDRVTADHFRDTWLAILDPNSGSAYSFLFDVIEGAQAYRTGETADPADVGIRAINAGVLEVTLGQPAAHFLDVLCHHSFVPVHPEMRRQADWSDLDTILSNGPYYILERSESELQLVRNELYWDRREVEIPRLRVEFENDTVATTSRFNRGDIHWLAGGIAFDQILYPEDIVINPMFATSYFFFRSDEEPYNDPRVRRALVLLLPWDEIRDPEIYFTPAQTLVPPIPRYPEADGITSSDEEEALGLLEEAGFPGGTGLRPVTVRIPGGEDNQRIADLMEASWGEYLNLEVAVEIVEYPQYFDSLEEDTYELGSISWIGDFADPLTFLQMWTSGSNLNDAGFSSTEYDALIGESMAQAGMERFETLSEAERIILETGVVLPISHSPAINLIDLARIDGWYPNPLDIHPFKHLRFRSRRPVPGVASRP
ncbi:MAG: peptide ABC transporter substrate-binding protein [Spirochaetaceae bacterium]